MDFADADNERLAVAELVAEEEDHYGLYSRIYLFLETAVLTAIVP